MRPPQRGNGLPSSVAIQWKPWMSRSIPTKVSLTDSGLMAEYELAGLLSRSASLDLEADAGERAEAAAGASVPDTKSYSVDENFTSWLQILGCFCLTFNTWGVINTFPVFEEFYSTELLRDYFPASIARIGSTQTFAMFTIAYILGPLFDAGYLQPMLWIGSALSTLGLFMTSFCVQFWQLFLAQGVITGIGFGCLLLPALALPTIHFERNLSLAMGLISCGGAVGGLILPVIFNTVRDSFHFAWATQVLAFILLGNCVLPLALLRYPRQPSENIFRLAGSAQERFTWLVSQLTDFLGFRDRYYVYVSLALALGAGGFHVMLANINLFTRDWTDSHKNIYLSMLEINTAASLAGRTVVPAVADRLGATNMQGLTALSSFVLAFSALAMKTADDMIAWSVGFGTCQGTFACLSIVGLVSKSRTRVGTKIGTASLMVGIGIFLASVIGDNILNGRWLWTGLIVWCALLLMASFVCTTAARIQLTGREIITRI